MSRFLDDGGGGKFIPGTGYGGLLNAWVYGCVAVTDNAIFNV
jgi:hypothetical protein